LLVIIPDNRGLNVDFEVEILAGADFFFRRLVLVFKCFAEDAARYGTDTLDVVEQVTQDTVVVVIVYRFA